MRDDDDDDDDDDDVDDADDDDHGSYLHLLIESPPTWHFKTTQLFRDSGVEQRQVWIRKGETGVWELWESLAGGSQSEWGF